MSEIAIPVPADLLLDSLKLFTPAQVNRSAWTGRRKVIGLSGAELWRGQATIDLIATEEDERQWRAFLFGLRGPVNWFRWALPCQRHIGPRPAVAAGASNGYTLPLDGMQASATILRAGQFMTVPLPSGHSRTVCLTADLRTNGSGQATATYEPALNETPTENATVETADPFIPMSPTDPTQGLDSQDGVSGASFDVEEAM
ncbi:MAG: hypothetical protein V4696_10655 [Pseudomonadota bacterium]